MSNVVPLRPAPTPLKPRRPADQVEALALAAAIAGLAAVFVAAAVFAYAFAWLRSRA